MPLPELLLVAPGGGTEPLSPPGPPGGAPPCPLLAAPTSGSGAASSFPGGSRPGHSRCPRAPAPPVGTGRQAGSGPAPAPPAAPAHLHLIAVEEVDVGLVLLRVLAHEQQHRRVAQLVQHRLAVPHRGQREVLQLLLRDRGSDAARTARPHSAGARPRRASNTGPDTDVGSLPRMWAGPKEHRAPRAWA